MKFVISRFIELVLIVIMTEVLHMIIPFREVYLIMILASGNILLEGLKYGYGLFLTFYDIL